jgi:hypothetical protein
MPPTKKAESVAKIAQKKIELDLTSAPLEGPLEPEATRFHFFIVDSGWNAAVSNAVRSHMDTIARASPHDVFYLLTPEQSVEILRLDPTLIGLDPVILVYDLFGAKDPAAKRYCGFRLNLGLFRHADQAMARLQEFLRFVIQHRSARRLDRAVKHELHREGLHGMVRVLREAANEFR